MSIKFADRRWLQEGEWVQMENQLGAVLHGVSPRPDFVSHLHGRLVSERVQARNNRRVFQYVFLSIIGIISGMLILVVGIRAVSTLVDRLGGIKTYEDHRPAARVGAPASGD